MALTVTRLREDNKPMRKVIVATEAWYLTEDKTRVVKEGDPEGRVLLVGKGGEIDATVAEAYGITTKETVEVSRVSQSAYEQYKNAVGFGTGNREGFDKDKLTETIAEKVNAQSPLNEGSGVTATQKAFLTEGLVNQELAKQDAEAANAPQDLTQEGGETGDEIKEPSNGESSQDGLAAKQPRNKRTKVIGETPPQTGEDSNPEDSGETGDGDPNETLDPDKDTGNGEAKTPETKANS